MLAAQRATMAAWMERTAAAAAAARKAAKMIRPVVLSAMDKRVQAEVGTEASGEERTRARKRLNQRDLRDRRHAESTDTSSIEAALVGLEPRTPPDMAKVKLQRDMDWRALQLWLRQPGKRQDQLRGRAAELIAARYVWLRLRERLGMSPTHARVAVALTTAAQRTSALGAESFTRHEARARLRIMESLRGPGAPWAQSLWSTGD